jgi:hypothetical protein
MVYLLVAAVCLDGSNTEPLKFLVIDDTDYSASPVAEILT